MSAAAGFLSACLSVALGGCFGSFVATAVVRQRRHEQAIRGRSRCDGCDRTLRGLETLPLISFALSQGRCKACGSVIDPLHLFGEFGGAAVVLSTGLIPAVDADGWILRVLCGTLGLLLLAIALYDHRSSIIPDALTAGVLVVSAILTYASPARSIWIGLSAAALSFAVLEVLRRSFLRFRRQPGIGFGDVKLLSALAVWLGPQTPWTVVLACILALTARIATRSLSGRVPFGPWIACGAWGVGVGCEAFLW